MSELLTQLPRRVVPRWRDFATTCALGELGTVKPQLKSTPLHADLVEAKEIWATTKNYITAGELLAAALVERAWPAVIEAATYLSKEDVRVPPFAKEIARRAIGWAGKEVAYPLVKANAHAAPAFDSRIIGVLRRTLANFQFSPIHWVELGLAYTIIGKTDKAEKAVLTALSLAPNDRFVLRCATRFFLHREAPSTAKRLLAKSSRTSTDPWLLAAHMSVADIMDEDAKLHRQARAIFDAKTISPHHLSELGSALATSEIKAGNDRKARRLFDQSLVTPTENAVAQAVWARGQKIVVGGLDKLLDLPFSFETNARRSIQAEDWDGALTEAQGWQNDEPFSVRPAMLGSFLASTAQEDFAVAEQIARRGLLANPDEPVLVNNLTYALACAGKIPEAKAMLNHLPRLNLDAAEKVMFSATEGLIEYRAGNSEGGRAKYEEAIRMAREHKLTSHHIRALLHLAREEVRVHSPGAGLLVQKSTELAIHHTDPAIRLTLSKLLGDSGKAEPVHPSLKSAPSERDQVITSSTPVRQFHAVEWNKPRK